MDYMVLSCLLGITLAGVVLSYDIACQWFKKFQLRMEEYPVHMQLPSDLQLDIGIPNWHVNGNGTFCRNNYSLNYLPGVGRTCGEDVEISWSQTNALAPSTREMGPGARKETLNDHWIGWNLRKITGFRMFLLYKLCLAV